MKKRGFIILGIVIILLVILMDGLTPKKITWEKTYNENNKNPFDLKIFHDQLKTIFKGNKVITIKNTFYEYSQEKKSPQIKKKNIYININQHFSQDESSTNKLLKFVAKGNIAFISANSFPEKLLDTLHLTKIYKSDDNISTKDILKLHLNKSLDSLNLKNKLKFSQNYFKDSTNLKSLAKVTYTSNDSVFSKTNFIRTRYKTGFFYLYTQPEVFTNYHLLEISNTNYLNQILSLLPYKKNQTIYFESNYKGDPDLANSSLRFIKKQKELYIAWVLLLVGVALFILINAKRKQKIIPIIPKIRNTSLDFINTISSLYEEADNFQPIAQDKINVFYKNIRNQYNITTDKTNTKLVKQLSLKSGYNLEKTKELIRFINVIKNRETSSIILLKKLNKEIEDFNKTTNAWKN